MSHLKIVNPATLEVIQELPTDSLSSIANKYEKAKKAQKAWRSVLMKERVACAVRLKALLLQNLEKLAHTLTAETGKPISQARGEIKAVTSRIDFFVERAPEVLSTKTVSSIGATVEERIEHEPLGIVANISAWNYPYFVGLNVLVPALLAGNAVLYKPSEYATLTGLQIDQLLKESGFVGDLVSTVIGGADAGNSLLELDLDGVFFTGSHLTGQRILNKVGSRMIRVQLELGGKDAIYVCDDSALQFAVPAIADGAFYNAGQSCCSVERVFIHESIYDSFKYELLKTVQSYVVGDPTKEDTYIGPLTRPQHAEFLLNQVEDAASWGCEILLGGKVLERKGSFFAPTVIACSAKECRVLSEESFGPIVAIQKVHDDEEATDRINDSIYGLTAGVYSSSKERALAVLRNIHVGSAYWNCCDRVSPYLPWSGRKASGIGVTLSDEGIRTFAQSKAWHLKMQA